MDAIDYKIVRELQGNARLTNNELAERVNLSPSPCLRRMRNLEKAGVLKGYTALVDQKKYGLPMSVFMMVRLERQTVETIDEFERYIHQIDDIVECYLMAGPSDYLLRVVSADMASYERFMKEKMTPIPGVRTIESNFAFGRVKSNNVFPAPETSGSG
jgi:Lrp/AsnC family transcriptional regulator, leucine-responsive regulatory protein